MRSNHSSPFFKGSIIKKIECSDITDLGYGVLKKDSYTIFARNILIGEVVDVQLIDVKKKFSIGKVIKHYNSSKDRVNPLCPFAKDCNGCKYQFMDYESQVRLKSEQLSKLFEREVEVIGAQNPNYYRNKIEFIYEDESLNMMGEQNKKVPIDSCKIAHQRINDLLNPLLESLNNNKHAKISNVILRYSKLEDAYMIIFVSKELNKYQERIAQEIVGYDSRVKSVILSHGDSTNYLFNEQEILLYGEEYLIDRLMDKDFKVSSKSFYQINQEQTKVLYQTAIDFAQFSSDDNIADLYCGVGTIGIIASDYVNHVLGVETVSDAVEAARDNVLLNEISNVDIIEHDLNEDFDILEGIDVAIVDPPRSGLSINIIDNLIQSNIPKIVYIACDPRTQYRDVKLFEAAGYKLEAIKGVDMFAMTHHVESIVLMTTCSLETKK